MKVTRTRRALPTILEEWAAREGHTFTVGCRAGLMSYAVNGAEVPRHVKLDTMAAGEVPNYYTAQLRGSWVDLDDDTDSMWCHDCQGMNHGAVPFSDGRGGYQCTRCGAGIKCDGCGAFWDESHACVSYG